MKRTKLEQAIFFSGKTKGQIAKESGIHPSVLSRITSGKARPSINTAMKLASVLGAKVEDVFNAR